MAKQIRLETRQQLNIYMSPVRQELMRVLRLSEEPMTPKALANRLGISPSSVQHHLKRLLELGTVEVDHKAVINGITATYYRDAGAEVRVGLAWDDGLQNDREVMATDMVNRILQAFFRDLRTFRAEPGGGEPAQFGDLFSGVAHLSPAEREELLERIRAFLVEHDVPAPGRTERWEYVLMAHRVGVRE